MKNIFVFLGPLILGLLPFCPMDAAVNPAIVSADARWVVYADMNALRASTLGKELMSMAEQAKFQTPQGAIGLDVPKLFATIGSVTAYGANLSQDPNAIDGTLVLQGTADLRKIAESLLLQATIASPKAFSEVTDLPFPAYAIAPNAPKDGTKFEVIIAFPTEPIILVGKSREQLIKARDVFRGKAPNLAKVSGSPIGKLLKGSENSYLFAASIVPSEKIFPDDQPQARILKMANSGALSIGEKGPNTFAHAELVASSNQTADKLMKILQGMTAILSLAESSDKQLSEFLNSTSVGRENDSVTLNLSYSSERIVQMIHTLQQKQTAAPERPANRNSQLIIGKSLVEWQAESAPGDDGSVPAPLAWRTVENVELKNGMLITLGRQSNGGKSVRFDRVEISPAQGAGSSTPLIFRAEFMKAAGNRNNLSQFQFPGADGSYTLKIAYINDPDGKATFAVSFKDPKAAQPESDSKAK